MTNNTIIMVILALMFSVVMSLITNQDNTQYTYEFREVKNLRCAGINAIGCTTVEGSHFIIEYVPNSQRCNKPGCITINDTINHEMNHTIQYQKYGRMWEWE